MKFSRIVAPLLAMAFCQAAGAYPQSRVQRVVDGDTVVLQSGERIRIACIDSPERGQYGFDGATRKTRSLVDGRTVGVRRISTDRYGRTVGEIYVDGINLGHELVRSGHARVVGRYKFQCPWAR